jgi:hypothetical protein
MARLPVHFIKWETVTQFGGSGDLGPEFGPMALRE